MAEGGGEEVPLNAACEDEPRPMTPPSEPSPIVDAFCSTASPHLCSSSPSSAHLSARGSHSLSRWNPSCAGGIASPNPALAAISQRFATYSPRQHPHNFPFPSPPPSPITLRSLRVRDDFVASAATRAALEGLLPADVNLNTAAASSGVSPHHPQHPVRKRLSQRLAAWSKNFKAKFKKSASGFGSGGVGESASASSSPSSSAKLNSEWSSLKRELLMDRVVASDGRSCTLTRRHQLSSDLPALLRSSSTSPGTTPNHHRLDDLGCSSTCVATTLSSSGSAVGATSGGGRTNGRGVSGASSLPVAVEGRSSTRRRKGKKDANQDMTRGMGTCSESRTPVGIVQSSAFIVTSSASSPKTSAPKMMNGSILESCPFHTGAMAEIEALSTSTRSEGGVPTGSELDSFKHRRMRRRDRPREEIALATDDEGVEERGDDDHGDENENRVAPPELPPRRRRVQSTDNILDLPGDRSLSSMSSQITTSLTTDDVASLRDSASTTSTYDVFARSIERLKECGWYWGPLSWEEASIILKDKHDGSFLVRDSSDDRYILSLSIRCNGRTLHTRIQHYKGLFSFWQQPWTHGCDTIVDFIEKCMTHSRNGSFMYFLRPAGMANMAPMPLLLLHPVSRLFKVPSLHHLARFAILKTVRRDNVEDLPLPRRLKQYLQEPQYLFEDLISVGEAEDSQDDDDLVEAAAVGASEDAA